MSDTEAPELVWLDHVQPVGLVVARAVLDELGLVPTRQTATDNARVADFLNIKNPGPALTDAWGFVQHVLGWQADSVVGIAGGPSVPAELCRVLPEHQITLHPTWAIRSARGEGEPMWQALVRIEDYGTDPDQRGALAGWEAKPIQRFERLLRETGVPIGVLIADFERDGHKHAELRLVYAPAGETSGWLGWPLLPLATVAGRPMLSGLKLLLDQHSLFTNRRETRLPQVLDASRKAQASVSTELSAQVLGALHELLRGLHAADPKLIEDLAARRPHDLYEGLLTVLMRLVFILYAEDRDLMPSMTDGRSRTLYEQGYSLRGLYAKLTGDEALYPDTMDERLGGWGRLLALFRLVHKGHPSGWIKGRGGKLFDPDVFPFLDGRQAKDEAPRVPHVRDGSILRILRGLMTLKGERLSYRTLDVEQIGSVYETVMGFTVEATKGRALAIKAGKSNRVPVFVDLDALVAKKPKDRIKTLKEDYSRASVNATQKLAIEEAQNATELERALESLIDERGSPGGHAAAPGAPILQPTDERRRTGSHYTPRTLTEPIVRHALEPTFERLGVDAKPEEILDIKVCDPAMGSGAFLVETCRQLAARLVRAWARWPETRPKIPQDEDEDLHARRLVAQRCLYGVDKNPLATDLAKLSLWLATLARDHEFEFVDHALKSGDSLVGLTNEQIAAANWDESKPGLPLFKNLLSERITEAINVRQEIQEAPDDVFRFMQERRQADLDKRLDPVRMIGNAVLSAFFAEAKPRLRDRERARVESLITGSLEADLPKLAEAATRLLQGAHPIRPFHWQLEFPEVFECKNGGFDAIIGNPPFLGGAKIWPMLGGSYPNWLKHVHAKSGGKAVDLVAHFFRRAERLLNRTGAFGLIATNTIAQGDTRAAGLKEICTAGCQIYRARRRLRWPGLAAVVVSVVHVTRTPRAAPIFLDGEPVDGINSFLLPNSKEFEPRPLRANIASCFRGCDTYGTGFIFSNAVGAVAGSIEEMNNLIAQNPRNAERIMPFIGGKELATHPQQHPHRYAINFADMSLDQAREWPDLLAIVIEKVKPERDKLGGYSVAERRRDYWWQYGTYTPALYRAIEGAVRVLAISQTTTFICFEFLPTKMVFSHKLIVIRIRYAHREFACLQSRLHEIWAVTLGSTMKDDPVYSPPDCFSTFPFPTGFELNAEIETTGRAYHKHRAELMVRRNEGLTKTYNRFHNSVDSTPDLVRLRELHAAMDVAVLRAYGWEDLAERAAPQHLDEANEDDQKYQGRYFWPAAFRDEVLARLLALNAERFEQERKAGLNPAPIKDVDDEGEGDSEAAA